MDNTIYKKRRINLSEQLPKNSALLIPGADIQYRNADSAYAFRQDSNFYYLSGFCEQESLIVILKGDDSCSSIVFVPPKDKLKEIWDGYRAGPIGAVDQYLFDKSYDNTEIEKLMPEILKGCEQVLYPIGKKNGFDQLVIDWTTEARSKDRHSKTINILDASSLIGNARLIKDDHEISLIRIACDISAEAHIEAMKNVKDAGSEQDIESLYIHEFSKNGGRFPAYTPIVASGENACVLHYIENNKKFNKEDLLLVDAGCEYEMYASDITRTYPISGKFSKEQLEIYEIVLEAHKQASAEIKPGNPWIRAQDTSVKVITEGLIDLGLLKGKANEIIKKGEYSKFYMHRIGHWLGMDVHDVGNYKKNGQWRDLEPGMVLTIEPGIYILDSLEDVEEKWLGIGIRIEDDLLVTENGNEVLSANAPRDIQDIESLRS